MATELLNKRTRNSKTSSLGGNKYAWDGTIGSIHYWADEQWKNIDNIFEPAIAPWDWEMLKADYHIKVKEDFTAGQIIEFEKQGETVQFQPMALEWTNDLDQIQPISMPQGVAPTITNPIVDLLPAVGMPSHQGTIRWNDGYGQGLDFEWRCTSTRLVKVLEIDSFTRLPTPEQYILDGGNPVLRLNLIFDPSNGVDIYTDGELWDKSSKEQTFNIIEFRKDGEVFWGFMPLRYWGSGEGEDNEGQSVATLEKRGNKLYISIRVPYEWLQTTVYPVFIDVDVDETIVAGTDDASERGDDTEFDRTGAVVKASAGTWPFQRYNGGIRFVTVAVPNGATISVAYVSVRPYTTSYDDPNDDIYLEDVDSAVNFEDNPDVTDRVTTAHSTPWVDTGLGTGYVNSPDFATAVKDVVDRGGWASNNDMVVLIKGRSDFASNFLWRSFENGSAYYEKFHIEYTEAAGWTGKISGVTNPAKVMGVDIANIAKVKGVA